MDSMIRSRLEADSKRHRDSEPRSQFPQHPSGLECLASFLTITPSGPRYLDEPRQALGLPEPPDHRSRVNCIQTILCREA